MRRYTKSKRGGGFFDQLSQSASSAWNKTKKASEDAYHSTASSLSGSKPAVPAPTPSQPTPGTPSMGGKRRRRRQMGGNFHSNMSNTNIASTAAPFSVKTASPQVMLGGRTRKHRCKTHCTNKHHKHCKGAGCKHKHHKICKDKHHRTCKHI